LSGWIEDVRRRLARTWPERPILEDKTGVEGDVRQAAVLIPLYVRDRQLFVLFTKRTETVEHHKGQISFPGGVKEDADQTLWHTAIREAEEEVGIAASGVKILGALPKVVTVTGFEISPFVGAIPYPCEWKPAGGEVEAVLEIPVSFLMDPRAVEYRNVTWKGRPVKTLVYHYSGHAIWGATAHILADLMEVLQTEPSGSN